MCPALLAMIGNANRMPRYSFECKSPDHDAMRHGPAAFEGFIQHSANKRVDQTRCGCGAIAKRDLAKDLPTIGVVGMTPISHSTTIKGSLAHETEFLAGQFKVLPDGSVDRNHRAFRDSGELQKYMNGQNDLGTPSVDDNGRVRRRRDGSVIREGAKLFKYGPNATPSRDGIRKRAFVPPRNIVIDSGWGDENAIRSKASGGGTMHREDFSRVEIPTQKYVSPERRSKTK